MNKFVIMILILILFFMSLQSWASLQKSSTDSETIEQAIARLIAVHNSDPTAHLGIDGSLLAHKSDEVIDHPALSIVPDKFSNGKSFLFLNVVPYISGSLNNCTASNALPFIQLFQNSPATGNGRYTISDFTPTDYNYSAGDSLFDFTIFGYGSSGTWYSELRFGWGVVELKAGYYRIGYYNGSWQYTAWTARTVTNPMRFRFQYDSVAHFLYVFINDVQVFSASYTMDILDGEFLLQATVDRGSSSSLTMGISNLNVWFDGM